MKIRVADYIAQHLEKIGVTHVFLVAGGGMMHLQDAISRQKTLRYVCNHHEQSCAYAAEAYSRAREGLGVCYATSGPGGANTVTGVIQAWLDSSPVLFITGQSKVSETIRGSKLFGLRQFGTFEVDIVPIVQTVTKSAVFLSDPQKARYELEKAIATAMSGRPGPVLMDIPLNVQSALIDPETLEGYTETVFMEPELSDRVVDDILDRLKNAKQPLILAGHGIRCAKAVELFRKILPILNVPTATTQLANDLLPYQDNLYVGHPGVKGDRPGGFAVQNADVLLTIGCSLHSMTTGYELDQFAPKAYKIQVELDEMIRKRENVGVQMKVPASVQTFLKKLESRLNARPKTAGTFIPSGHWHERCRVWKSELAVNKEKHPHPSGQLNYYDVIDALSELSKGDETIVADAGSAFYITGQAFRPKGTQRVILAGALAQMGYTTSATVGACFSNLKRQVIGITGDGSFQTNIHDLAVMSYHQLNAKLIVVNNGGYVSIRNTQNNYFGGFMAGVDKKTGLLFPDHQKLCEAYGIRYFCATKDSELKIQMKKALEAPGPVVFEVMTAYEQEIIPSVQSQRLPDGTMISKPLQDMYPFMTPEELARQMDSR